MKNLIKTFESFSFDNSEGHEGSHEPENYMFFGNLETIHRLVGEMLQMEPRQIDQILKSGHNWAADHIATSKDDIEEVAGFFMNELSGPSRAEHSMELHEESDEMYDGYDGEDVYYNASEGYACNECGKMYEAHEIDEDMLCNECGSPLTVVVESEYYDDNDDDDYADDDQISPYKFTPLVAPLDRADNPYRDKVNFAEDPEVDAERAGLKAGKDGSSEENPYFKGSMLYRSWEKGYAKGKTKMH